MIIKPQSDLLGFKVFSATTGMPVTNRKIAITNDGKLLLEMLDKKNVYMDIPKHGDFIINYGDGRLELW